MNLIIDIMFDIAKAEYLSQRSRSVYMPSPVEAFFV